MLSDSYVISNYYLCIRHSSRTGHLTETALIRLSDEILLNMDKDEMTGLIFIDFRKAFDVINHELLLRKLAVYGANTSAVSWFKSYLSERKQFIKLENVTSEQLSRHQGVPQGSILGPVLFLLFVNDMLLHASRSTMDIYADDTTLFPSSNRKYHKLLGLKFDHDLSYKKLSKRLGLLRYISPYLKQKQQLVYYQAVIKPIMLYAS